MQETFLVNTNAFLPLHFLLDEPDGYRLSDGYGATRQPLRARRPRPPPRGAGRPGRARRDGLVAAALRESGPGPRVPPPGDDRGADVPGDLAGEGEGVRGARGRDERGGVPPTGLRPLLIGHENQGPRLNRNCFEGRPLHSWRAMNRTARAAALLATAVLAAAIL